MAKVEFVNFEPEKIAVITLKQHKKELLYFYNFGLFISLLIVKALEFAYPENYKVSIWFMAFVLVCVVITNLNSDLIIT